MLAKRVPALPEGPPWSYEVKFDGYRMEALKDGRAVRLLSRNAADYTARFAKVAEAVAKVKASTLILDGEVVVVDQQGKPSFQMLQNRAKPPRGWHIVYYVFDLLHLDGTDLRGQPLSERRRQLSPLLTGNVLRLSETLDASAAAIIEAVEQQGLEGVVAKRLNSRYEPGQRSGAWVKLPLKRRQEFVIGGYRPGGRNFDLLLVGYFQSGKLIFAGKVRQGFNPGIRAKVFKAIQPLHIRMCLFSNLPNSKSDHFGESVTADEMADYVWLHPEMVAEIKFTEWTHGEVLRHAEFVGFREDKPAHEVVREI